MNDDFDQIEAELSALKPQTLSAALKQRIARDHEAGLLAPQKSPPTRTWWIGAVTGGLVAASLVVGVALRPIPVVKPQADAPLPALELPLAAAWDDSLPSVWNYQRAFARSPQALEEMFDKHAALSPPASGRVAAHLFIHADSRRLLQGEL